MRDKPNPVSSSSPGRRGQAPKPLRHLVALTLLQASLVASPLSAQTAAGAGQVDAGRAADWLPRLDAAIGAARCSDDAECRSVGIGAQACGGPQFYRAWSVRDTDAAAVGALVQGHREARLREIAAAGEMSTCAVPQDPGTICLRAPATPSAALGECRMRNAGTPAGHTVAR